MRGVLPTARAYCASGVVSTGVTVLEKSMALPANRDIVAGLSYWISEGASRGITMEGFMEDQVEAPCGFQMVVDNTDAEDLLALTPANMILPLLTFGFCCLLAVLMRAYVLVKKEGSKKDGDGSDSSPTGEWKPHPDKKGMVPVEAIQDLLDCQQQLVQQQNKLLQAISSKEDSSTSGSDFAQAVGRRMSDHSHSIHL